MRILRNKPREIITLFDNLNLKALTDSGDYLELQFADESNYSNPKIPIEASVETLVQIKATEAFRSGQSARLVLITRQKKPGNENSSNKLAGALLALSVNYDSINGKKFSEATCPKERQLLEEAFLKVITERMDKSPSMVMKTGKGYVAVFSLKKPAYGLDQELVRRKLVGLRQFSTELTSESAENWPPSIPLPGSLELGNHRIPMSCEIIANNPHYRYSLEELPEAESYEDMISAPMAVSINIKTEQNSVATRLVNQEKVEENVLRTPRRKLPEGMSFDTTGAITDHGRQNSPYYLENGYIMKAPVQEGDKPQSVCRRIEIDQIRRDIDTETVTLKLSYDYLDRSCSREISRGMLTRSKLLTLQEYGVDVVDDPAKLRLLLHYLRHEESSAPLVNIHDRVGFGEADGKLIYKLYDTIGYDSIYNGSLKIKPQGTLGEWLNLIKKHVIGHVPLEFALTLGLSAPFISLLARDKIMDVILFHIYGDSTTGKSTACALAVSPFGSPNIREDGLVKTWNGTDNAIAALMRGIHGVPVVLDEASIKGCGDYTSFIYSTASGIDKKRLDRDGKLRPGADWSGIIISNAEHSLKIGSKQNSGINARLFEAASQRWTKSAEHAHAVMEGVSKNYGHAGPVFVENLLQLGTSGVRALHQKWYQTVAKSLPKSSRMAERIAGKLAVFPATAELAGMALGIELDSDAVCRFAIEMLAEEGRDQSIDVRAYQCFTKAVARYRKYFSTNSSITHQAQECWGRLCYIGERLDEIEIDTDVFARLMQEGGFEDAELILKGWRKLNWLSHDAGKLTRKRAIIPKLEPRVYVVKVISENEIDGFETAWDTQTDIGGSETRALSRRGNLVAVK